MAYLYPAMVAFTSNGNSVVKNAVFQVYAPGDTAFATPLPITDNMGNTLSNLNSGSQGVFPAFQQAQYTTVVVSDTPNHQYAWTVPAVLTGVVLQWGPNTYYPQGATVVNPSGDVVVANANHTSSTTYDSTKWNYSSTVPPGTLDGGNATSTYAGTFNFDGGTANG